MISVIIPTFNSSKYLQQCLNSLIKCKSINEIVISDDFSDSDDLLNLKKIISNHQLKNKIKLHENNINKGAYRNKLDSVKKASSDLVYILDSDNIAGFNLENILYKISKIDDETRLYIPSKIYHFYNHVNIFTPLYKSLSGKLEIFTKNDLVINSHQIKKIFEGEDNIMYEKNKSIYWILNIGNFIFSKDSFLKNVENEQNFSREMLSMDAVAFTYYWLRNGNTLYLMNDHYHFHRKRQDSVSWTEKENSKISRKHFDKHFLDIGT
jgi:glycosyltransferase involved in cell wall biosynthesis